MKLFETIFDLFLKVFSMLVLILLPIRSIMIAISVLVIADLITGVWASKKEGQNITSNGLKRTISKTIAYQTAVIVAFIIETYLVPEMPVIKVVAGLIGLTEGKSFFENIHRITGIDFWSVALKKLHSVTSFFPENNKK